MPLHTYEQRPPQVRAVQFDGTNLTECAALLELDDAPPMEQDEDGAYFGWVQLEGLPPYRISATDWLVVQPWGGRPVPMTDTQFRSAYRDQEATK